MTKRSKAAYMISAVAEQYQIHPQTLRLYEREGLLKPSRSDGNTRLYTDEDLERLEVILKLTRDLGVNLAGVEIILNMRERMAEMQHQIEQFVSSLNTEISQRARPCRVAAGEFADPGDRDAAAEEDELVRVGRTPWFALDGLVLAENYRAAGASCITCTSFARLAAAGRHHVTSCADQESVKFLRWFGDFCADMVERHRRNDNAAC